MLEGLTAGLHQAGHEVEVVDLYAIGFDPMFRQRDMASYLHEGMPPDILERMDLRRWFAENVPGGSIGRASTRPGTLGISGRRCCRQRTGVHRAGVLAALSGDPQGWYARVFAYGSAYALSRKGWEGHASGRIPLMHHDQALVVTRTLSSEADYPPGRLGAADAAHHRRLGPALPGVKHVEHVFFYGAAVAESGQIQEYLHRTRELGRDFAVPAPGRAAVGASTRMEEERIMPVDAFTTMSSAQLRKRSVANLVRMGHCAPAVM